MTSKTLFLFLFFLSSISSASILAAAIVRDFGGMRATYTGSGSMTATPTLANNVWGIEITGVQSTEIGNLSIKPTSKNRNSVYIDSITSDGSLNAINIKFPQGYNLASCVRNIYVDGDLKALKITGGDLGASDGYDGELIVKGNLTTLLVKALKYNVPGTTETELWGGNIWASIFVDGTLSKIMLKGGNMHYTPYAGIQGVLQTSGNIGLIAVDGQTIKTDRADKNSTVFYGGGLKTDIYVENFDIKQLRIKGGVIDGAGIHCKSISRLAIFGQDMKHAPSPYGQAHQGIFNSVVETKNSYANYSDCSLKKIDIKNGSIEKSNFVVKGNINSLKISGDSASDIGNIKDSIIRVGYEGAISVNKAPEITPETLKDQVISSTHYVTPFTFGSEDSGELLAIRIQQRGPALDAVISNYYGETFSGSNIWYVSENVQSGMFVWTAKDYIEGSYSNIVIRVSDNGTPNLYDELNLNLTVVQSNLYPTITLDPSDSHRYFNNLYESNLNWKVTLSDINISQPLSLSVTYDDPTLDLIYTNRSQNVYDVFPANSLATGDYGNIVFTVTDNGALSSSKTVLLTVVSNTTASLSTSLPDNTFIGTAGDVVDFQIFADVGEPISLVFERPSTLPAGVSYTNAFFANVYSASNRFDWTTTADDAGQYTWIFEVYDFDNTFVSSEIEVTVILSNLISAVGSDYIETSENDIYATAPVGNYAGQIGTISVVGSIDDSEFIGGCIDFDTYVWSSATYLGFIRSLSFGLNCQDNLFVSGKPIIIKSDSGLDYTSNQVWVDGERILTP